MHVNGEAIYGTAASPFPKPLPWGRVTRKGKRLFLHLFEAKDWILLPGLTSKVAGVKTLAGGRRLRYRSTADGVEIASQDASQDPIATVVEVDLRSDPRIVPILIRQVPGRTLDLTAADADVHGKAARLQGDNIGYWTDVHDTVSWSFESLPGEATVELEYACEPGAAGGNFAVDVGGRTFAGKVKSTGSWNSFRRVVLGKIQLSGGKTSIEVRPVSMPSYALMNLRAVRLVPSP